MSSSSILCLNGSDSTGKSGIQSDIRTVRDLGGTALTVVTSVTVQNSSGIAQIHELPTSLVVGQVKAVYEDVTPSAVKVGMINDPETIKAVRDEIVGCRNIICSPGILASHGGCLMSNDSLYALCHYLIPICKLLMLKCTDAEILLGCRINNDEDMVTAAKALNEMGAEWVMLRGGTFINDSINALLYTEGQQEFFSSPNIEGWQQHGVSGTLSTAIAHYLACGDDVPKAIENAHTYIHNQILYSGEGSATIRPTELYNAFLSRIADNYQSAHDVTYYASALSITSRYLSQITKSVAGKSPKQIIDEYLIQKIDNLLLSTSMNIQQIADSLGFSSQIALTKLYKNKKGFSPSEFRRQRTLV